MQKTANNYLGLVTFYDTQPGNKMGLFYHDARAHMGIEACPWTVVTFVQSSKTVLQYSCALPAHPCLCSKSDVYDLY